MTKPVPGEGQFFTLNPVPPPELRATTHWGLPLALGLLTIPLLMFGFGFSQQQQPATTLATSSTATSSVSPLPTPPAATTPQPQASAPPPLDPLSVPTPLPLPSLPIDPATLPIAHIQSPGIAANFRAAPSLQSAVLGVLMHSDLVELLPEHYIQQDGVMWVPVRWRGQSGWLASNFLGGSTHAQP